MKAEQILKKHKKDIEKLQVIEEKLTSAISATENYELMETYEAWANQRNVCNQRYIKWIKSLKTQES